MEDEESLDKTAKANRAFFIEAAIDERGPRILKIVPSYRQYLVYDDENALTCIQLNDENEWEQIDGPLTQGVVSIIGREISRAKNQKLNN